LKEVKGVYVRNVKENSAAEEAGLKSDDVIVSADGVDTKTTPELQEMIGKKNPGDIVKVKVIRDGKEKFFDVKLKGLDGKTTLKIAEKTEVNKALDTDFETLTRDERLKLKIASGIKVKNFGSKSILRAAGVPVGFVITSIDKKAVATVNDVKTAFEYYLAHNNAGRPIIIASHSQGSTHTKRLLKEFFENKPLYSKLVAAYVIGMPVPTNLYTAIPSCDLPNQTGCVCSWRTYQQDYIPAAITLEKNKAIVTNPLSWNTQITHVNRKDNKGGILLKFNSLVKHVADATINDGVLWTVKPHFFGNIFYCMSHTLSGLHKCFSTTHFVIVLSCAT
jgi:hypothetical protein